MKERTEKWLTKYVIDAGTATLERMGELVPDMFSSAAARCTPEFGFTAEGMLNHALHYGTDERLKQKFTNFLGKYGYGYMCICNCFYLVFRK